MSNGVTDVDKQQYPAPKHSRIGWYLLIAGLLLFAAAGGAWLDHYAYMRSPPPPSVPVIQRVPETRIVEVTRVMTPGPTETPRTIVVYRDQTVVVTREVTRTVNTFYTPTPPTEGRG